MSSFEDFGMFGDEAVLGRDEFLREQNEVHGMDFDEYRRWLAETESEPEGEDEGDTMSDVEADADTLASAGMGTDEDYNHYDYGDEGW
jgi:hypothetical protein